MLRPPAAERRVTAVLETPETVAIAMQSANSMGAPWLVDTYLAALRDALAAAQRAVLPPWRVEHAEQHLAPAADPTIPQPHAHLTVVGTGDPAGWALTAHRAFQTALRGGVPGMRTVDQPHPPGWEIATLLPRCGSIGRHRCLAPSSAVLYPADLDTTEDYPVASTA